MKREAFIMLKMGSGTRYVEIGLFYQNFIKMFHEANPLKPYIWMLPPMEIKQWKGVIFMNWKLPRFCKKIFYVGRPHLGIKANISKWAWVKILTGLNHKYKCCKFIFQYLLAMTLFKRPNKTELSNPNWWGTALKGNMLAGGCGTVGRAVASDTRGLGLNPAISNYYWALI